MCFQDLLFPSYIHIEIRIPFIKVMQHDVIAIGDMLQKGVQVEENKK